MSTPFLILTIFVLIHGLMKIYFKDTVLRTRFEGIVQAATGLAMLAFWHEMVGKNL